MSSGGKGRRGRPPKTFEHHAQEAARVLEVALLLHRMRSALPAALDAAVSRYGFASGAAALRFVQKRRRGAVAEFIGADVDALLGGKLNPTRAAVRLITEHGLTVRQALGASGAHALDERGVRRAVKAAGLARRDSVAQGPSGSEPQIEDHIFSPKSSL